MTCCPPPPIDWVTHFVPIIVSIVALLASSTIPVVVFRSQSRASKEKLRLDLYERRFSIFDRLISFYQALLDSPDNFPKPEFVALHRDFIKSVRESQFLFADDAGIFVMLKDLQKSAFKRVIAPIKAKSEDPKVVQEAISDLSLIGFDDQVDKIEKALKPYLGFQNVMSAPSGTV